MDAEFVQARITFYQSLITSLEAAFLGISTGTLASYTLSDGQTSQTITKKNLGVLQNALNAAMGQLELWTMRRDGGNVTILQ